MRKLGSAELRQTSGVSKSWADCVLTGQTTVLLSSWENMMMPGKEKLEPQTHLLPFGESIWQHVTAKGRKTKGVTSRNRRHLKSFRNKWAASSGCCGKWFAIYQVSSLLFLNLAWLRLGKKWRGTGTSGLLSISSDFFFHGSILKTRAQARARTLRRPLECTSSSGTTSSAWLESRGSRGAWRYIITEAESWQKGGSWNPDCLWWAQMEGIGLVIRKEEPWERGRDGETERWGVQGLKTAAWKTASRPDQCSQRVSLASRTNAAESPPTRWHKEGAASKEFMS